MQLARSFKLGLHRHSLSFHSFLSNRYRGMQARSSRAYILKTDFLFPQRLFSWSTIRSSAIMVSALWNASAEGNLERVSELLNAGSQEDIEIKGS